MNLVVLQNNANEGGKWGNQTGGEGDNKDRRVCDSSLPHAGHFELDWAPLIALPANGDGGPYRAPQRSQSSCEAKYVVEDLGGVILRFVLSSLSWLFSTAPWGQ